MGKFGYLKGITSAFVLCNKKAGAINSGLIKKWQLQTIWQVFS